VVSNIFYFHPYLGKIPILTNIFEGGWNHQLGGVVGPYLELEFGALFVWGLVYVWNFDSMFHHFLYVISGESE